MSLFICSKCGTVENSSLVSNPINGPLICSGCKTGIWHGQFEQQEPTQEEIEIASYSAYCYITPFDHEQGCLDVSETGIITLNKNYDSLHKVFRELFNKEHTDHISDFEDNFFRVVYQIFKEDRINFNFNEFYHDVKWDNPISVLDYVNKCLIYPNESKSRSYKFLHASVSTMGSHARQTGNKNDMATVLAGLTAMSGMSLDDFIPNRRYGRPSKPHWKKTQTDEERNSKLAAAEAKRLRKQNKG